MHKLFVSESHSGKRNPEYFFVARPPGATRLLLPRKFFAFLLTSVTSLNSTYDATPTEILQLILNTWNTFAGCTNSALQEKDVSSLSSSCHQPSPHSPSPSFRWSTEKGSSYGSTTIRSATCHNPLSPYSGRESRGQCILGCSDF
jgi:hypothetical protein